MHVMKRSKIYARNMNFGTQDSSSLAGLLLWSKWEVSSLKASKNNCVPWMKQTKKSTNHQGTPLQYTEHNRKTRKESIQIRMKFSPQFPRVASSIHSSAPPKSAKAQHAACCSRTFVDEMKHPRVVKGHNFSGEQPWSVLFFSVTQTCLKNGHDTLVKK